MSFPNLHLVSSDYIKQIPAGASIEVEEKNAGGAGICRFQSASISLMIRARSQSPVVWALKNRKCAEAAFLTVDANEQLILHIVEMKSTLSTSEFYKVIEQWRGMYLSALSILGVLKTSQPIRVMAYVAYKQERVSQPVSTQVVLQKTQVGGKRMPGIQEWVANEVSLHHGITARIVKGLRSPDNVDFGVV